MHFTREQYAENIGPWYLDDFPIPADDEFMFQLFNLLPNNLQGQVLRFGPSDTEVRENIFEFLSKVCFGFEVCKFYELELYESKALSLDFIAQKISEHNKKLSGRFSV